MSGRTVTCRLCGERLELPDAPWDEQLEWIDSWADEHGRARHDDPPELPISVRPDPIRE